MFKTAIYYKKYKRNKYYISEFCLYLKNEIYQECIHSLQKPVLNESKLTGVGINFRKIYNRMTKNCFIFYIFPLKH